MLFAEGSLAVKIEEKDGKPLEWSFQIVDEGGQNLSRSSTNPEGVFSGEYVLNLRKGFQRSLILVLDGCDLTDSKLVPEIREITEDEERQQQEREEDERIRQSRQARERYLSEMASMFEGKMAISDRVVKLEQGEYLVPGVITVNKGGTLEIPAGVVLRFGREGGIRCQGKLLVRGVLSEPVVFQPAEEGSDWINITLQGEGTENSLIEHAVIKGGRGSGGAVEVIHRSKRDGGDYKIYKPGIGGGLLLQQVGESVEIKNVELSQNRAVQGGAIYCIQSKPILRELAILHNEAEEDGGGIFMYACTEEQGIPNTEPKIIDCEIKGNKAKKAGGGLFIVSSNPELDNLQIVGNQAEQGGGVFVQDKNALAARDDYIEREKSRRENEAKEQARAIAAKRWKTSKILLSDKQTDEIEKEILAKKGRIKDPAVSIYKPQLAVVFKNSVVKANQASTGGGLWIDWGAEVVMSDLLVRENKAKGHGGGVRIQGRDFNASLSQVTVEENCAEKYGGVCLFSEIALLEEEEIIRLVENFIANNQVKDNKPDDFGVDLPDLKGIVARRKVRKETREGMMVILIIMTAVAASIGSCIDQCK